MTTWPILSVVTFLPRGRRAADLSQPRRRRGRRGQCALDRAVDHADHLWRFADPGAGASIPRQPDFQFVEKAPWLAGGITYHMGVDGISLPFVILTTFLMPFCILASWKSIKSGCANT